MQHLAILSLSLGAFLILRWARPCPLGRELFSRLPRQSPGYADAKYPDSERGTARKRTRRERGGRLVSSECFLRCGVVW